MKQLLIAVIIGGSTLTACNNNTQYEIKSKDPYEKGMLSVKEIEQKTPSRFLTVKAADKKNILGQTVIKGTIFNNAKMVHYKDVQLKLSFYSGTGTLLEEDQETVYETINPGGGKAFKSKYFAPKSTDSVALKVIGAKF